MFIWLLNLFKRPPACYHSTYKVVDTNYWFEDPSSKCYYSTIACTQCGINTSLRIPNIKVKTFTPGNIVLKSDIDRLWQD